MQSSTQLVSAGLMGVLLVATVAAVVSFRDWRHDATVPGGGSTTLGVRAYGAAGRALHSQLVWILGFLLLAFALGGAVVLFVAGGPMSADAGMTVALVAGCVLLVFLGVGTYRTVRFRGRSSAGAAAVTAWTLGTLALVAIVANLLLG
ncbi:hypothetical protein [Halomarina rubra]|uniref:Uncharacterized protein n=1 Tax=Halomarina rubra TaxID=2071873 RepID=A0ABD6AZ76_9EURY|nr:hypothetical protein [Halomarina rubra]